VTEPTAQDEFEAFRVRMDRDPRVVGVVLSGSQAREGTATVHSDYDLIIVAADGSEESLSGEARRDARLDVSVISLTEFRTHALPGSGFEWSRYSYTHARTLKDTDNGLISDLVTAKGRLTAVEAARLAPNMLDGFLNSAYRSLKSDRDGNAVAARLDAAESLPGYLSYIFALHDRVRPYNKYLSWELRRFPLSRPEWAHDHLLSRLTEVVSPMAARAVRQLLNELEPLARADGHGEVLDSWGDDLAFMQGDR
jgi:hypothetical protein